MRYFLNVVHLRGICLINGLDAQNDFGHHHKMGNFCPEWPNLKLVIPHGRAC